MARAADAAVGDQRNAGLERSVGALAHGGELRHADARDEPSGARESRPDPDLDGIRAGGGQVTDAVARRDVARHDLDAGPGSLQLRHGLDRSIRMAVGDVEHEGVHLRGDQRPSSVEVVTANAHRARDAQAALRVAGRPRIAVGEREILERDEPGDRAVLGDQRQLFDAVRGQEASRLVQPDTRWCGDEPLAGRHQRLHAVSVLTRQQVARREEAEQPPVAVDDEEPGHRQPVGFGSCLSERQAGLDGVRLGDDVGEISLHAPYLCGLLVDRQEAVDDPDAAELGHRHRHRRGRDGIHVRRHDRYLQPDSGREARSRRDVLAGSHPRAARHEQDVVVGEPERDFAHDATSSGTISKRSTSTRPRSVSFSDGITESARNASVRNGVAPDQPSAAAASLQARLRSITSASGASESSPATGSGQSAITFPSATATMPPPIDARCSTAKIMSLVVHPDDDQVVGIVCDGGSESPPFQARPRDEAEPDAAGCEVALDHGDLGEIGRRIGDSAARVHDRVADERTRHDLILDQPDRTDLPSRRGNLEIREAMGAIRTV